MGRTNPTFRDRIRRIENEWQGFRQGLRIDDQSHFDQVFDDAIAHAAAAGYQNPADPWKALFLAVVIEQQRRLTEIEQQLERTKNTEAGE